MHAVARGIGRGQHRDFFQNLPQVHFFQPQIAGTSEVDQDLHDAVEAVNFVADDVHVAARVGIVLLQLVLQQLQMQHDGIDGVLDLVRHASGQAAAGGKAARNFNLILNAAHRFGIAHGEQRADRRALFLNEVERHLHAAAIGSVEFVLHQRTLLLECGQNHCAQNRSIGENFFRGASQDFAARAAQKFFRRGAHQHDPRIAREEHEPVLQLGHDLLDVVFQRGENLVGIANLPAQVRDLQRDQADFVAELGLLVRQDGFARARAVEVAG